MQQIVSPQSPVSRKQTAQTRHGTQATVRNSHVILATRDTWILATFPHLTSGIVRCWKLRDDLILGLVEKLQSHCPLRHNKYTKQAVKSCRQSRALTHFPCCQSSKAPTCNIYSYTHPSMKFLCFMIPGKE